jgi:transposase-like protein
MANRRPPFTADEKLVIEEMILSKKYTDAEIAKKLKCSKTTIKLIRTRKYRILIKRRKKYDEAIKQTMFIMYREDNLKVIDIARRLRIKYHTVWEILERAGVKDPLEKKPYQRIRNKKIFNYSLWLTDFLKFLEKKLYIRGRKTLIEWIRLSEPQLLGLYVNKFNETNDVDVFYEKGKIK